ncbi:unnamed protein product, partial [Didymodactylos carnosus]
MARKWTNIEKSLKLKMIDHFWNIFDSDSNGTIDFEEFVTTCAKLNSEDTDPTELLELVFEMADLSNDGHITVDELTKLFSSFKTADKTEPRKLARQITYELDVDTDKKISKTEFINGCMEKEEDLLPLFYDILGRTNKTTDDEEETDSEKYDEGEDQTKKGDKEERRLSTEYDTPRQQQELDEEKQKPPATKSTSPDKIHITTDITDRQVHLLHKRTMMKKADEFVWSAITCDGCKMSPLIGERYYCKTCDNYDLCARCQQKGHEHELML